MTQDTLTATAAQYHHRWQQYLHEQEIGRRSSHLTPRDRAWCDEAITERMARVGFDRASVLATIAADVSPELAEATIESVVVLGAFRASAAVKSALAGRIG